MASLAEIIGDSAGIRRLREQLEQILKRAATAPRPPSLLLRGETGTGKGLVARTIHRAGPRAQGPFVDLNCAAIPENLLEAELFGYERGAFTGANQAKPGLFQLAHQGVLFLDEIGTLTPALQAKLLKVLEDGSVRRLGATRAEPVDVWIVSATNEDLTEAMRARRFREGRGAAVGAKRGLAQVTRRRPGLRRLLPRGSAPNHRARRGPGAESRWRSMRRSRTAGLVHGCSAPA